MHKKSIYLSLACCLFVQHAQGATPWLELKPSYFFFTAAPLKDVYHKGGFEIQVSGSGPVCRHFDLYGSIGVQRVQGHALNTDSKTAMTVVPGDLGLKGIYAFRERYHCFFAFGPRFFYFHQHNHSPYVDSVVKGGGVGLFINTGLNVVYADHFLLGIFGEYSYAKKSVKPKMLNVFSSGGVQLSGLAFGTSVGYAF